MQLPRDKSQQSDDSDATGHLVEVGKLIRTISSALIVMENSNRPMTSRCAMKKDTVMRCSCFASGSMLANPSTIVMMPTNTLTKKVERIPKR